MSKDRLLQVLKTTGGWVFVVFCLLLALGAGAFFAARTGLLKLFGPEG